jgi:hypothetical protein
LWRGFGKLKKEHYLIVPKALPQVPHGLGGKVDKYD